MAFTWVGFGTSFGPIILLSLYWERLSAIGVFAGMITGVAVVMIWGNASGDPNGISDFYGVALGLVGNLTVAVAVLRMSQPLKEISMGFDAAVAASWA